MTAYIEKDLRTFLLTLDAVTALVGARIRPMRIEQDDDLPAIVITDVTEEPDNDLNGNGGLVLATVNVMAIAETLEGARDLAEAIRLNGTDPGTGLAGYSGPAGDLDVKAWLKTRQSSIILADDSGQDSDWYIVESIYEIHFNEVE